MRFFLAVLSGAFLIGCTSAGAGTVEGTTRSGDGAALVGAAVHVLPDTITEAVREPVASAVSDREGRFILEVPDGTYQVSGTARGLAGAVVRKVEVSSGVPTPAVNLTLGKEGRTLSGIVQAPKGGPAGKVWVYALDLASLEAAPFIAAPDNDGKFALTVPAGSYFLGATLGELDSDTALARGIGDEWVELSFPTPAKGPAPAEVIAWIRKKAVPLAGVQAGSGFEDLAPLKKTIGDARVVALGEATHGTREFFQLKHRMLEFLVKEMGFTVFAIEASLPDALAVDDYVVRGVGDPAQALAGLGFWTWNTQEVLDMILWMRRYNEDPAVERKLRFFGFDMQAPSSTADQLGILLRKREKSEEAAKLLDALDPLMSMNPEEKASEGERAQVAAAIESLDAHVKAHPVEAPHDQALALRLVELLRQAAGMRWGGSFLVRDEAMAENTRWILEQEPAGTRMVVWAHNGHVNFDEEMRAGTSMGSHLRRSLDAQYLVFGFAFDHGSFQAVEPKKGLHPMSVGPAKEESLDAALAQVGPGVFALDLRKIPRRGDVAAWFAVSRPARSVGALFDPAREKDYYAAQKPARTYDALLFVKETTSAIPVASSSDSRARRAMPPAPESAANLDFEGETLEVGRGGWFSPTGAGGYRAVLDTAAPAEGRQCARLDREGERTERKVGFGNIMQRVSAAPYLGKKVRFKAHVRAEVEGSGNQAQLWLRVDRKEGQRGFFDNMGDRPIRDVEWKPYEIVGEIAPDAESLNFGIILLGEGRAWIDGASLELVEPTGP